MRAGTTTWIMAGMLTVISCGGLAGQPAARSNVVYEIPDGFRGWVMIEYSSPACHAPIDYRGRTVIPVSKGGTGCSSRSRAEGWISSAVRYAGQSGPSITNGAGGGEGQPARLLEGQDPQTVFVWWGMGWTCEDSGLQVQTFFVGTTDEYNKNRDAWQNLKCGAKPSP